MGCKTTGTSRLARSMIATSISMSSARIDEAVAQRNIILVNPQTAIHAVALEAQR
jgi:hypothetical protein